MDDGTDGATDSAHAQIVIAATPMSAVWSQNGAFYATNASGNTLSALPASRQQNMGHPNASLLALRVGGGLKEGGSAVWK